MPHRSPGIIGSTPELWTFAVLNCQILILLLLLVESHCSLGNPPPSIPSPCGFLIDWFGCIRSYLRHAESFVEAHGLSSFSKWASERTGSVVKAHGPSCSAACGILVPQPGIVLHITRQIFNHWTTREGPPMWFQMGRSKYKAPAYHWKHYILC